jgi:hypothetical protein
VPAIAAATRAELGTGGLGSPAGIVAVTLAERLDHSDDEPLSSVASLARAYRESYDRAVASAGGVAVPPPHNVVPFRRGGVS